MSGRSDFRNDYDSQGDTSDFTHAALVYTVFTFGVFFLVCCICRLPELLFQLRNRQQQASSSQSETTQPRPEIKQLTAAAIFVNPSGNSISVGTLSEDIGQTHLQSDQSKEQEGLP